MVAPFEFEDSTDANQFDYVEWSIHHTLAGKVDEGQSETKRVDLTQSMGREIKGVA